MNIKALIKHLSALLLFGMNGIVASHIALSSYEIVFTRTLIGSIFLFGLFFIMKGKSHMRGNSKDVIYMALSGVSMAASWIFLFQSYQLIGVSMGILLYYFGPVIVMIFSPVIFRERLTWQKVLGFITVLVGIICINGGFTFETIGIEGLACGLLSAFTYFLMVVFNKKATHIVGMENSLIQMVVSFIVLAVFIGIKQNFVIDFPTDSWAWIILLGIVNTGVGCFLYFSTISELPAQTVALCGYLEPLSAVIFAALLLGERMTAVQYIGAMCIIGGAMFGELVHSKNHKTEC